MTRRRPRGLPLDGWLIIDKPAGLTSTDVVNRVRRAFNAQKAGHGGTLDPLATGVLPIAFGAGTKTVPYIMDGTKQYHFTLRFGESRDTDDAEGAVVARSDHRPSAAEIEQALPAFRGSIMQVPPAYSAIKVAGERAYDMARDGRAPQLEARPARVDRFELIERPDSDTAVFFVESGKGVYMRSLARDLAIACGTVGHITTLRRLRVGPFLEAHAIPLAEIWPTQPEETASPDLLQPVAAALGDIPELHLTGAEAADLRQGTPVHLDEAGTLRLPAQPLLNGGLLRSVFDGRLIGMCRLDGMTLRPERLF